MDVMSRTGWNLVGVDCADRLDAVTANARLKPKIARNIDGLKREYARMLLVAQDNSSRFSQFIVIAGL
jgi:hypothetical protein